jgi:L-amino acid N-acyltransferase YncA
MTRPPASSIQIRAATSAVAADVAAIYNETILKRDATMVLDPVDADYVQQWLSRLLDRETLLVLEENGLIQGWGIVKLYSDRPGYARACETSLFLRRKESGRGLGSRLQEALLVQARQNGFHHVVVKIWAANASSIAMHRKFGFEVVGTQKEIGYVDGTWVDVTIMQCLLPS